MERIDARGKQCPIPVIMAKKAIEAFPKNGGSVAIMVDNDIARQNLQKMAQGMGVEFEYTEIGTDFEITISTDKGIASAQKTGGAVYALGQNKMGQQIELGGILIKGFIYALREISPLPSAVIFFNSGVNLLLESANTAQDILLLQQAGVRIMACGTCVNYFNIAGQMIKCDVVNMYEIAQTMASASSVINI